LERHIQRTIISSLLFLTACQSPPKEQLQRDSCSSSQKTLGTAEFSVDVSLYSGAAPSRKTILILPPTGGSTYIDRSMSKRLCRAGFDVYILEKWTGMDEMSDELQLHHRLYTRALKAISEVLKSVPQNNFVGLLGTSVGATFVAVAVSQIDRIDAAFSIAGGAPIPGIIVNSDHKSMHELRERRYKKFGFKNNDDYFRALEPEFPLDPFKSKKRFSGKTLGMSIATKDTTVPTRYQKELEQLWKPQTVYTVDSAHFWGIVNTWYRHDKDIVQFFIDASK